METHSYDLIYAALIFEYDDLHSLISQISSALKVNGTLAVILQLENESLPNVSETTFHSLKLLNSIIKIIDTIHIKSVASKFGLKEKKFFEYDLKSGKKFYVEFYSI